MKEGGGSQAVVVDLVVVVVVKGMHLTAQVLTIASQVTHVAIDKVYVSLVQ